MKVGYARVSTSDQNLNLQLDALKREGCEKIFAEKMTGKLRYRPEFDKVMDILREGDELIVYKLDRIGRSLINVVNIINELTERKVTIKCTAEAINTTTPQGKMMYGLMAVIAEYERNQISERTKAGLAAARARGRIGGRKPGLSKIAKIKAKQAADLYLNERLSVTEMLNILGLSKTTFYKYLKLQGVEITRGRRIVRNKYKKQ